MALLLAILLLGATVAAGQSGGGTAVIRGRVIAADTGEPIPGAAVWAISSAVVEDERSVLAHSMQRSRTDDRGAFLLTGLPPGSCVVMAVPPDDKRMYLQSSSIGGALPVFDLADGQILDVDVVLRRAGAISGRVVDEYGRPMAGVPVTVLARLTGGRLGRRPLAETSPVSDDYGRYRAWGLPSGTYYVRAEPAWHPSGPDDDPEAERFVRTYYPGVTSFAEASAITLRTSEDLVNVDVRVASSRTFRLSGVIVDPGGRPVPDADVHLDFADERTAQSGLRDMSDADGRFEFTRLLPADYVLGASVPGGADGPRAARPMRLTVAVTDRRDLRLTIAAGVTLAGEIVTDVGAPPPFDPAGVRLMALGVQDVERAVVPVGPAVIHGDWRFELPGILAPVVLRLERLPKGWFLQDATLDGNDVLDTPTDFFAERDNAALRLVVSNRGATLAGVVEDAAGRPAAMRAIWLLRDRDVLPAPWFSGSRTALSDERGGFELAAIPPGRYLVLAANRSPSTPPDDERLADMIKFATPVTLDPQQRKEVRLRVVAWPY